MKTNNKRQTAPTPGPWEFVVYGLKPELIEKQRKLGIEPERRLTNDGEVSVMGGAGDDRRLVALVSCHVEYRRNQGHQTECSERDANARLIAAAPTMRGYIRAKAEAGDQEARAILAAIDGEGAAK